MLDIFFERKSIRDFTSEEVRESDLNYILQAAMASPTAMNSKCYSFLVIRNKTMHKQIAMIHKSAQMILTAPLAILVLGDSNLAYEGYLPQDCAASTQNILLAATAKGYGSVWCGIYSNTNREKAISMLFKLPKNIKPFSLVVIGKKSDISKNKVDVREKKQYLTNKVKYETWN